MTPLHLLYVDAVHQADPRFWQVLGRALGGEHPPCLVVHGAGDRIERLREARGLLPDEALPPGTVERVLRMETHRIVGWLTDAGVPAVGFHGGDRGLLQRQGDGRLTAPGAAGLLDLARRRAVPVVSTLLDADTVGETAEVVAALARASTPPARVVLFSRTGRPGLVENGTLRSSAPLEAVSLDDLLHDPAVARTLLGDVGEIWITSPFGLVHTGGLQGTRLTAQPGKNAIPG